MVSTIVDVKMGTYEVPTRMCSWHARDDGSGH